MCTITSQVMTISHTCEHALGGRSEQNIPGAVGSPGYGTRRAEDSESSSVSSGFYCVSFGYTMMEGK